MPPRGFPPGQGLPQDMPLLTRRRLQGSQHMSPEEIESILRLQWKSLHGASPYHEDYYYQVLIASCFISGSQTKLPNIKPASSSGFVP